jgi:DNA-binding transcriptional MerR regulator
VNIETLRYYERRGLLAEPDRSPGGHRLCGAETVTTLRVIKAAQRLGFTLEEVADLLGVGVTGAAATALTLTFAGLVFGVVVALATVAAIVARRRQARRSTCGDGAAGEVTGPVPVQLLGSPPGRV